MTRLVYKAKALGRKFYRFSLGGISYATTEAFEQGYFPELAKGCERQVCLSLKQGTIKETVQKVLSVNRSLNLRTLNRKDFALQATSPVVELSVLGSTSYPQD